MSSESHENPDLRALREACRALDRAREGLDGPPRSVLERFECEDRVYTVTVRTTKHRTRLTPREAEVVALLRRGHSNKVIAFELGLAWSTVRVLVQRITRKLGVRTRLELEALFLDAA
jgi:DNA-binding NarL/FixJ family response regulator